MDDCSAAGRIVCGECASVGAAWVQPAARSATAIYQSTDQDVVSTASKRRGERAPGDTTVGRHHYRAAVETGIETLACGSHGSGSHRSEPTMTTARPGHRNRQRIMPIQWDLFHRGDPDHADIRPPRPKCRSLPATRRPIPASLLT